MAITIREINGGGFYIQELLTLKCYGHEEFVYYFWDLLDAGIIEKANDNFKWAYSKTSLTDFIKEIHKKYNKDYSWFPLERFFGFKKGTLRRLASPNGNPFKEDNPEGKSEDYYKILEKLNMLTSS